MWGCWIPGLRHGLKPSCLNPYCAGCGVAGDYCPSFDIKMNGLNPYCAGCGVAGKGHWCIATKYTRLNPYCAGCGVAGHQPVRVGF